MIRVLGIGPGAEKYMTLDVREKILEAEYVLAFGRVAETLRGLRSDIQRIQTLSELLPLPEGEVCILASGDSLFYGISDYLMRKGVPVDEIHPGLTSFQYFMAKLKLPWQDAYLGSLHSREGALERVKYHALSILLTDRDHSPTVISGQLVQLGVRGRIIAGYDLSYETERIEEKRIGEVFADGSSLAVVVVHNEMV
ncbi:MAG: precorrin-6y C5,15-methyltransferase (decarboxylating) subunit CbiE [Tissierellia bacterium]|nr:precorrin-6y C5,15-methyltransferase (decarboxylating) subunit CbiE [Tissierellia bacterium]